MTSTSSGVFSSNRAIAERLLKSLVQSQLAASDDPIELAYAVGIEIRAAHLIGMEHINAVSHEFPASIQGLMDLPEPEIDTDRDAYVESHDYIGFLELIDILSEEESECIAPHIHRGWQDKVQSCREARGIARNATKYSIGTNYREWLLKAMAIHNRVFHVPAPVQLHSTKVRTALSSVLDLIERLAIPPVKSEELTSLINSLRKQIQN
ncbi:MAG: hypothetical protein GY847_24625 [Proteobacteria bacterium]|nr:hypothetical protein [Pseudomonadota bacterium]